MNVDFNTSARVSSTSEDLSDVPELEIARHAIIHDARMQAKRQRLSVVRKIFGLEVSTV